MEKVEFVHGLIENKMGKCMLTIATIVTGEKKGILTLYKVQCIVYKYVLGQVHWHVSLLAWMSV